MLTDEELIQQIRLRLHDELEEMYPADRVIHVWEQVVPPTHSRATPAARAHGRFRNFRTTVGVLAAFAAAAIVVVAALALSGGVSKRATQSAAAQSSERPLLRILGVLRHPQTSADLPPALRRTLGRPGLNGTIGSPDLAGVRLAGVTPAGEQVFLVPFKPPTVASTSAYLSEVPASHRARARAALESSLPALDAQGDRLEIQLMYHGQDRGTSNAPIARDIKRGHAVTWSPSGYAGTTEVVLVVPDGVAKVSLLVPNHRSTGLATVTGKVHNNVVVLSVPSSPHPPTQRMIWYGPKGNLLQRFGDSTFNPSPPASSVRAPISIHIITATRYCYGVKSHVEVPCEHLIPSGDKVFRSGPGPHALVNISYKARLAATNDHSVYEYSYGRVSGPANCTLNTGGTSGTSMNRIHVGQIVTLQDDSFVCPGTWQGVITYQPNGGPGQDTLDFESPIRDGSVLVGRFTFVIRKP